MSTFPGEESTPQLDTEWALTDADAAAEAMALPPGGFLDLDDALAEALAAVEAVEAQHTADSAHDTQAMAMPEELLAAPPESALPPQPDGAVPPRLEVRGLPTLSSADARSQLADEVRDLKLKLSDVRRLQERDQKEIDQLMADLSVTRKRYHKLGAEHDELRKRLQRAELDLPEQGARNVLNALLAPLDHLHEIFSHLTRQEPLTAEAREALTMLQSEWQRAFSALQVTPFDAVGQPYDAHLHEFIAQVPSDQPVGVVMRQVGRGYLLGGRLLRPARVVVSGGLPGVGQPESEAESEAVADS